MKKSILTIIAITICIIFSGCAAIINGSYDSVTVNSLVDGASIYIDGVEMGYNDVTTQLKRGKTHIIKVKKEGCKTKVIQTGKSFDFTSLLGILIDWGIISIPIDLISGSAFKTDPTLYTVSPICTPK